MTDQVGAISINLVATKAADQKHCFSCGNIVHFSAFQCPRCGAQQPSLGESQASGIPAAMQSTDTEVLRNHQAFCRGCGSIIHDNALACPKCGAPQRLAATFDGQLQKSSRDKTVAAVLAIFLGSFGVHKFYLGSIFLGFLYLLFFWTLIPGLIGFCEGIYYLTLNDDEFSRKFC